MQTAQSQGRLALAPSGQSATTQLGGIAPSSHIPLGGLGRAHNFQEQALSLHAYRLQLIASNIANADTPHYKAVDIDFREALRAAGGFNEHHHSGQISGSAPSVPLKYHLPQQDSVDGNTVELDVERAKFAESALRYEFSLNRVSGHYKMMMELLKE